MPKQIEVKGWMIFKEGKAVENIIHPTFEQAKDEKKWWWYSKHKVINIRKVTALITVEE